MNDNPNNDAGIPENPKRDFLRVAARLINDIGYKGASVERIVSELKITKGSFYHYLDTKDDLILECYKHDYRRMLLIQEAIDAQTQDTLPRLVSGIESTFMLQLDGHHPLLRTTALHAMPVGLRRQAIQRFDRLARLLAGVVVDGMSEGSIRIIDPMIAANSIISTVNSAFDLRGWARPQQRKAVPQPAPVPRLPKRLPTGAVRRPGQRAVVALQIARRQVIEHQ